MRTRVVNYGRIAVDAAGGVHAAWQDRDGAESLMYGLRGGDGVWSITELDATGATGFHADIVVTDDCGVHIAHRDDDVPALRYAASGSR